MDDLWQEIQSLTQQLDKSVKALRNNGNAYAEAERKYRIELRKACLQLKSEGMAIGLIDKVCYGVPEVAEARFQRDTAQTVYDANKDAINAIKLRIKLLDSQISREWGESK